jgi:CBS domain-containing membrane protein
MAAALIGGGVRPLLARALQSNSTKEQTHMQVRHIMSTDLETVQRDDSYRDADVLMRLRRIRHLPVVDDEQHLVGLVTHRDLLSARGQPLTVDQIMTKDVAACPPNMRVLDAARLILDNKFGCLPVVDNDRLVGIVTEADFVRWAVEECNSLH